MKHRGLASALALVVGLTAPPAKAGDIKDIWEMAKEIYCMTFECEPPPPPPPEQVQIGYLVVLSGSRIREMDMLSESDRLCAPRRHIERARLNPEVFHSKLVVVSPPEIYPAMQRGVCTAGLMFDAGEDQRYPAGITDVRFVPIYMDEPLYNKRRRFLEK